MAQNNAKFQVGQTIVRIVDGRATEAGHEYVVISSDTFSEGKEQLVADGGFVKELLTPEREKEFALKAEKISKT